MCTIHLLVHGGWRRWYRICKWKYIRRMVSMRKHNRCSDGWGEVAWRCSDGVTHRSTVHAHTMHIGLGSVLDWGSKCSWIRWIRIHLLACNWSLMSWNVSSIIDTCNVVNTWPSSISIHGIQTNKVFLGMTSYLCWCSRYHKIPWNTSPISFPKFV